MASVAAKASNGKAFGTEKSRQKDIRTTNLVAARGMSPLFTTHFNNVLLL
jgi:hypothetical protein